MTTWATCLDHLAAGLTNPAAGQGEPVLLPDGRTFLAVFNPGAEPGWHASANVIDALDQHPTPGLQLPAKDADTYAPALKMGNTLHIRATDYLIAEPPEPDGQGLAHIALMPAQAQDADNTAEAQRWR